ncbi:LAMI_0F13168g1_1 [Lachancea mirantina]|uniref:ADP-ribose 1''-phosphate phosphatase n=1 Tax=Lachancea mirantina TaxID=1230905 RepID=A0A1G4K391_9SACH|nr:LAMI_0F13168g1_1 [Lachancea mirantina]
MVAANIKYVTGNCLSSAIDYPRILIHSCNCDGSWGGGIAYQLAKKYPQAEEVYVDACRKLSSELLGRFMLIPTTDSQLLIGCLFTASFGGRQPSGNNILQNTKLALMDMQRKVKEDYKPVDEIDRYIDACWVKAKSGSVIESYNLEMPKINSGIFGVPWDKTEAVLAQFFDLNFKVYML